MKGQPVSQIPLKIQRHLSVRSQPVTPKPLVQVHKADTGDLVSLRAG